MIFLAALGFTALCLIDVPRLVREKHWPELIVYSVVMALAITETVLQILNVDVPDPAENTQFVVKWLFEQIGLTYG